MKDKEMQQQIRILATNLEILNQKLNQNPDALLNPAEAALKEKIDDVGKSINYIKNVLKTNQNEPGKGIGEQRDLLRTEIARLSQVIQGMTGFDKEWMTNLNYRVDRFNKAASSLSQNMSSYHQNMSQMLETQKAEVTKRIYFKLFRSLKKDNLIMMAFTSVLSSTIALAALFITLIYVIK